MNVKKFLIITGIGAILLSLAGFFHILGPDASHSIFGSKWWLDNSENWGHLVMGLLSLAIGIFLSASWQETYAWIMAFISIGFSIYSIAIFHLLNKNMENPIEEVIYFTVGNIAIWSMVYQVTKDRKKELQDLHKISEIK